MSKEKFAEKKLQTAFDLCSSGLIMIEGDGRIALINAEAVRMFDYQSQQLIGQSLELLIPKYLYSLCALKPIDAVLPSPVNNLGPNSATGRRQDGTEFPIEVDLRSIHHTDNFACLCVIADITDRLRLERLKDEFVSTVSHELRTPMTSIFASLSLLNSGAAGKMPDPAARLLAISQANCARLVRLVDDILDVQKLESGQTIFKLERVNVRSLAEKTIDALRGFASEHGISLRLDVASAECQVNADPDRLVQVITNLLSNAIKFSSADTEVKIAIERRNETVVILVRDHGPGIPAEFKSRIFDKFAQADGTDARAKNGTGLGLSIVRQIVERLRGQVGFRDAPGGGTIFYVVLPCWVNKTETGSEIASLLHSDRPVARAVSRRPA